MTREPARASALYVHVLAFCAGMSIMAVELCASRLVAPYFGTSTFVWTNVIGVMLVALSLGYLVGGRLADRRPALDVILRLLLLACAYLLALPYAAEPALAALSSLLAGLHSSFTFIFAGSLAAIVLLFAPPVVVMGMTGPFLIRVLARQGHLGEVAGRVFAVSTLGSVLGTFLPALVLVPAVGTSKTIAIFAGILLVVAGLGLRRRAGAAAAALALALVLAPVPAMRKLPGEIWAGESAYQTVEVIDRGDFRYLAYDDAIGWESVAGKSGQATGMYFDDYARLPAYLGRPARSALVLGLGGGVIANALQDAYPGLAVTGVEIDPLVIDVARRYFDLNPRTRVVNQDGRIFVRLDRGSYDLAVVDAYARQLYIPFHLATRQFFSQVKARLAPDGLLAMNVSSAGADSPLMRALRATLRAVFAHVYTMRIPGAPNYMLLAGDRVPSFPDPGGDAAAFREDRGGDASRALTDDRAPVELMMDRELLALSVPARAEKLPRPDHVVVVIEENKSFDQVIARSVMTKSAAPYINSLAGRGALFTSSYALVHPSQPNYLALFSGSTHGVRDDRCPLELSGPNLAGALLERGLSFATYSESMPAAGFRGCFSGDRLYARKHNPAVNWRSLPAAVNLRFADFPRDYRKLPTVALVIPNLIDDMHNGVDSEAAIGRGDAWLKANIDPYVRWAMSHNSLLILTWDEDDFSSVNRIPTLFVGPMVRPGRYAGRIDHYSVLRTLSDMYGLPAPGDAARAEPVTGVWRLAD